MTGYGTSIQTPPPNAPCAPDALDALECDALGLQEQAQYLQSTAATTEDRRTKFDQVRQLYVTAKAAAEPEVKEVANQVQHLKGQLECMITDEKRRKGLQQALDTVLKRLEECGGDGGCCISTADCDVSIPDPPDPKDNDKNWIGNLRTRLAEIEAQTKRAEDCFGELVTEPEAIPQRVQRLRTAVAALAAELATDPSKLDLDRAYARVLVAERDGANIWLGFTNTNAFHDCLCAALSCAVRGRQAVGILKHHIAVEECKERAKADACTWLANNVADEVVAVYHRVPAP